MLSQMDIKLGMETLNIHNGKVARQAGYPSPIECGPHMISQPTSDEAGDAVTSSDALTNSTDQLDLMRGSTLGPILSICAWQLGSLHG